MPAGNNAAYISSLVRIAFEPRSFAGVLLVARLVEDNT